MSHWKIKKLHLVQIGPGDFDYVFTISDGKTIINPSCSQPITSLFFISSKIRALTKVKADQWWQGRKL